MNAPGRMLAASLLLAALFPSVLYANSPPVVTNVVATQIPNTGQVRVTYDCSDADGDQVTARLICSADNGATFTLLPVTVSGNVNVTMSPGPGKQIIWDAGRDYPGRFWTQVVAKVLVSDGPATSGEMVPVAAGSFIMGTNSGIGAEGPAHNVTLSAYWIDKYEVSNAEYQQFIDAGGYSTPAYWSAAGWAWRQSFGAATPENWNAYGPPYPGFPVTGVSYYEAEAYAAFVGKRLPTEAEWERAARGTDGRTYPWGETLDARRSNYYGSGDPFDNWRTPVGFFDGRTHPNPIFVTIDSPSPAGCYDMSGNVNEWVRDWYQSDYYTFSPANDPGGPLTGSVRVIRGGSFLTQDYVYCTYRDHGTRQANGNYYSIGGPEIRDFTLGFRCARSAP